MEIPCSSPQPSRAGAAAIRSSAKRPYSPEPPFARTFSGSARTSSADAAPEACCSAVGDPRIR
ncbi:hypothetical protein AB0420_13580 [Streptomyces caelestis]|uniref:hypothetical protein n=1 Tax=Streptomyces TaxID=1883 RepID=UPI0006AF4EC6|nr:hypothetical protein [Streptomyces sp. XY152]KOV24237.1 hypothetical protein ADK58_21080 [Streptomyces sp. XY152]